MKGGLAMRNEIGEVRPTQVITTYGPGAIIDSVKDSLVLLDIEYWESNLETIYDNRLTAFLRKQYFKKIPSDGSRDLPSIPFPNYHVCSNNKCRRIFDIRENFDLKMYLQNGPTCPRCTWKSYPARFVISCDSGNHLDDFPWRWWAHKKKETDCDGDLQLISTGKDSTLSSMIVKCLKCDSEDSLKGAMQKHNFKSLKCSGNHPHRMNNKESCDGKIIPLQRGASNVYFPVLRSSISIPYENNEKQLKLEETADIIRGYEEAFGERALKTSYKTLLEKTDLFESFDDFRIEWEKFKKNQSQPSSNIDKYEQIKEFEYEAFRNFKDSKEIGRDFKVQEEMIPSDLSIYFNRIIKVHRLKEILVLLGFTRNDIPEPEVRDPKSIVWLGSKKGISSWLPAIEVFGEGIFIEFNINSINNWIDSNNEVKLRSNVMRKLYRNYIQEKGWSLQGERDIVYVLLHTLSHVLIKELSLQSGYSTSALKERIYFNKNMAGILIYTGNADQEGTLGGLVEMGEINNFRRLLLDALEKAKYCSNDPNCSTQEPLEQNYINGASCFACTMLPETACETGNMLLDRSLLIETMESSITPYFRGLI